MSRDGWLPPGVTDADIDRTAEPDYEHWRTWHCTACGQANGYEDIRCTQCHKEFEPDVDDWEY
jgi:hypothetical protein